MHPTTRATTASDRLSAGNWTHPVQLPAGRHLLSSSVPYRGGSVSMTDRRTPRRDLERRRSRPRSKRRVEPRTEPPAVVAARILKLIHDDYRIARAAANNTTTVELEVEERRNRARTWSTRQDRARYRALRDELRFRGVETPPAPPAHRRRLPSGRWV